MAADVCGYNASEVVINEWVLWIRVLLITHRWSGTSAGCGVAGAWALQDGYAQSSSSSAGARRWRCLWEAASEELRRLHPHFQMSILNLDTGMPNLAFRNLKFEFVNVKDMDFGIKTVFFIRENTSLTKHNSTQNSEQVTMEELQSKDVEFFSMENMKSNEKVVDFVYTSMCVIAGCIAGILGLTGLAGFAFLAVAYVATAVTVWVFKLQMRVSVYFNTSTLSFIFAGVFSQALSFILFWTLSYGLVHIY